MRQRTGLHARGRRAVPNEEDHRAHKPADNMERGQVSAGSTSSTLCWWWRAPQAAAYQWINRTALLAQVLRYLKRVEVFKDFKNKEPGGLRRAETRTAKRARP